jgi:hypothetical protein
MSYKKLPNINYMIDTQSGNNYKMAITNCRLPYLPEIEYINYKDVLLSRINFMIGLLGKTRSDAVTLLNRNGIPIIHSAKFLQLPDEEAAEYTSIICHTIIDILRDNVLKELTIPVIKMCVMSSIDIHEVNNFNLWLYNNAHDLVYDIKPYIELNNNGDVYIFVNDDDICIFANHVYDIFTMS